MFMSSSQKSIIIIVTSCFFYGLSIGINFVIIPLMFKNYGLSKTVIGLLMGIEIMAAFCMAPLLPRLVNHFGMGKILLLAGIIRNGMLLLLPLWQGPLFWFPAMFFAGSGGFSLFIVTQMWVNGLASNKRRATVLSALTALLSLGIAAGPLLLPLIGSAGFLPFLVSSMFCCLIAPPFYAVRKSLPEKMKERGANILAIIRKAPIPAIGGGMSDFVFFSMTSFLVLYGLAHGLSEAQAALLITAMMLGGIVVQVPIGWISDQVHRPMMVIICTAILLICSQLLGIAIKGTYAPWILFTFCSGSLGGIYTSSLAMLSENFTGKDLVSANSAFAMMNSAGAISGVVLSGIAMDIWGSEGLTYSIAFICILYLIMNITAFYIKKEKI